MYKVQVEQVFHGLPAQTLHGFESIRRASTYPKGALLFVEGQAPRGIIVLCSGKVRLSSSTSDGKSFIVGTAESGDILGLNATVSGKPHQLSAESIELCKVYWVSREDFVRFLKQYPDACLRVAQWFSDNYRITRRQAIMRAHSVSERLAQLLLEYQARTGKPFAREARIDLTLSQEEIAHTIGVARETVSRALSELKKRGILRGRRSSWVICNEPALREIAGEY